MEEYLNKYYETGDSLIKVLNILDSDQGSIFVCLRFSTHHNCFNIEINNEGEFMQWYESNEIKDGEFIMPEVIAKHLLE
jgi:hypothetical protein